MAATPPARQNHRSREGRHPIAGGRSGSSGAAATMPLTSDPGMNGGSGFSWYSPRLSRTSG